MDSRSGIARRLGLFMYIFRLASGVYSCGCFVPFFSELFKIRQYVVNVGWRPSFGLAIRISRATLMDSSCVFTCKQVRGNSANGSQTQMCEPAFIPVVEDKVDVVRLANFRRFCLVERAPQKRRPPRPVLGSGKAIFRSTWRWSWRASPRSLSCKKEN